MNFFTTDFNRLHERLVKAISENDAELTLKTFETISRFHRDKAIDRTILSDVADVAYSRGCCFLASLAYEQMFEGIDLEREIPEELGIYALKLGLVLARHTLLLQKARNFLKHAQKVFEKTSISKGELPKPQETHRLTRELVFKGSDATFADTDEAICMEIGNPLETANNEINRIEGILSLHSIEESALGESKSVVFLGYVKTPPTHDFSQFLSNITRKNVYEFSKRLGTKNGYIIRNCKDPGLAENLVEELQAGEIPSAFVADKVIENILPAVVLAQAVAIMPEGIELGSSLHKPVLYRWENLEVIDVARMHSVETRIDNSNRYKNFAGYAFSGGVNQYRSSESRSQNRMKTIESNKFLLAIVCKDPETTAVIDLETATIRRPYSMVSSVPIPKEEWLAEEILHYAKNALIGLGANYLSMEGTKGNWNTFTYKQLPDYMDKLRWMLLLKRYVLTKSQPSDLRNTDKRLPQLGDAQDADFSDY